MITRPTTTGRYERSENRHVRDRPGFLKRIMSVAMYDASWRTPRPTTSSRLFGNKALSAVCPSLDRSPPSGSDISENIRFTSETSTNILPVTSRCASLSRGHHKISISTAPLLPTRRKREIPVRKASYQCFLQVATAVAQKTLLL